jgi:hypothetical protein
MDRKNSEGLLRLVAMNRTTHVLPTPVTDRPRHLFRQSNSQFATTECGVTLSFMPLLPVCWSLSIEPIA